MPNLVEYLSGVGGVLSIDDGPGTLGNRAEK